MSSMRLGERLICFIGEDTRWRTLNIAPQFSVDAKTHRGSCLLSGSWRCWQSYEDVIVRRTFPHTQNIKSWQEWWSWSKERPRKFGNEDISNEQHEIWWACRSRVDPQKKVLRTHDYIKSVILVWTRPIMVVFHCPFPNVASEARCQNVKLKRSPPKKLSRGLTIEVCHLVWAGHFRIIFLCPWKKDKSAHKASFTKLGRPVYEE